MNLNDAGIQGSKLGSPRSSAAMALIIVASALGPHLSLEPRVGAPIFLFRILIAFLTPFALFQLLRSWGDFTGGRRFFAFVSVFAAWGLISLSWTPVPDQGAREVGAALLAMSGGAMVVTLSRGDSRAVAVARSAWLVAFLICGFVAVWELTTGQSLRDPRPLLDGGRPALRSTFGNSNDFAGFLLFCFPLLIASLIRSRSLISRLLSGSCVGACVVMLPLTGSRTGVLGIFLTGVIYVLASKRAKHPATVLILWFGALAASLITLTGRIPSILENFLQPVLVESPSLIGQVVQAESRQRLVSIGLEFAVDSGLMGRGASSFEYLAARESAGVGLILTDPHNLLVELLAKYGVVVTLLFIVVVTQTVTKWTRVVRHGRLTEGAAGLSALAGLLLASLVSSSVLEQSWWWTAFGTLVALSWSDHKAIGASR